MPRGRWRPNLEEPGLPEALAAYELFLDEVVTESQYGTRQENVDVIAACGDIIERAAARARKQGGSRP